MAKDLSRIKVIFLDVGSTLVDEDPVHIARFAKLIPEIEKNTGRRPTINEYIGKVYEIGAARYGVAYAALYALGMPHGIHMPYNAAYERIYPNVKNGLKRLSEVCRLGIIANQRPGLPEHLKELGVYEYLDSGLIFGSDDVGMEKPDERIFRAALEKAGVTPEESIMVGDRPDNDIIPANLIGMCTARIHSGPNGRLVDGSPEAVPDIDAANFLDFTEKMLGCLLPQQNPENE